MNRLAAALDDHTPACREDPEQMFVEGVEQHRATRVCGPCPLITDCAAYALEHRIDKGVWGGLTERDRRARLRAHPEVDDWDAELRRPQNRQDRAARAA